MKTMIHKEKLAISHFTEKKGRSQVEKIPFTTLLYVVTISSGLTGYVAVLRPRRLLEFYPNKALLEAHEWVAWGFSKTETFQLLYNLFSLFI